MSEIVETFRAASLTAQIWISIGLGFVTYGLIAAGVALSIVRPLKVRLGTGLAVLCAGVFAWLAMFWLLLLAP